MKINTPGIAMGTGLVLAVGALILAMGFVNPMPLYAAESKSMRSCVDLGDLSTRRILDHESLFVQDNLGHAALLKLTQPCKQMDDLDRIGFEFDGSTQLCGPHDVKILYSRPMDSIGVRCLIDTIQPLTREEARAIDKGGYAPSSHH